jgi:alpha-L-fucosidase
VAAGGGMTLNVGPDADGTIPMLQQERLRDLGDWLRVNGEAIYGSRPYRKMCESDSTVFYTKQGGNLYAIATHLDGKTLVLKNMPRLGLLSQVKLLGCNKLIVHYYLAGNLYIRLNNLTPEDLLKTKGAWVFRITKYGDQ